MLWWQGGVCGPMAAWGCDWHCRQRHDAGPRSTAGRRSRADQPDPGDRDGPDAVQPGRGAAPSSGRPRSTPLKSKGHLTPTPARGALIAGRRWRSSTRCWRSVHVGDPRAVQLQRLCAVQRPYLTQRLRWAGAGLTGPQRIGEAKGSVTVFNRRISATTRYRR